MKKILLVAAIAALSSTSALAADLGSRVYTKAPAPVVAPVYNWTGIYIGGHVGGAWNSNNGFEDVNGNIPLGAMTSRSKSGTFLGGGQIGADYQFSPNWLIGIEGQISGLSENDRIFALPNGRGRGQSLDIIRDRSEWLASVTGRLGYTWGAGLLYVKGGVGFRDNDGISNISGVPANFWVDRKQTGYTVGGGLEYMFAPAWSAKVEYQYYSFDRTTIGTDFYNVKNVISYRDNLHTVKAGINYHFNWGGPVASRY